MTMGVAMKSATIKWIKATYKNLKLKTNYKWVDGKWYIWKDKYGHEELARMKSDAFDHFLPTTAFIQEEDIVAFREVEEGELCYEKSNN